MAKKGKEICLNIAYTPRQYKPKIPAFAKEFFVALDLDGYARIYSCTYSDYEWIPGRNTPKYKRGDAKFVKKALRDYKRGMLGQLHGGVLHVFTSFTPQMMPRQTRVYVLKKGLIAIGQHGDAAASAVTLRMEDAVETVEKALKRVGRGTVIVLRKTIARWKSIRARRDRDAKRRKERA